MGLLEEGFHGLCYRNPVRNCEGGVATLRERSSAHRSEVCSGRVFPREAAVGDG
jgi:hypothetical protein